MVRDGVRGRYAESLDDVGANRGADAGGML